MQFNGLTLLCMCELFRVRSIKKLLTFGWEMEQCDVDKFWKLTERKQLFRLRM